MLELRDVSKIFEDGKQTLNHITYTFEEGSFTTIVGASGSGKSTLLKLIAGLEEPTLGEILLDGKKIAGPGSDRVVMFQESALFPWYTVLENVKFGLKVADMPEAEQERIAMHYLKMVHLAEYRNYPVNKLSGGMKQRAAFARALSLDSKILLMDEPFSALDKQTTNHLRKQVEKIWMETHRTIILITHSVEEAVFFGDNVLFLSHKRNRLEQVIPVPLDRPRQINDPDFMRLRKEILGLIENDDIEGNIM